MVVFQRSSDNLGARVMKGTALLAAARLIVRAFSLINIMVLARLLTPADYGIAALAIAAVATFTTFSDLKITMALIATDRVERTHLDSAFTLSLARGLIMAAVVFFAADAVAGLMDTPQLAPVLRVLSAVFLLDGLSNPAFWMYQRNIDFSKEFGRATIAQALTSVVTISTAVYLQSYWAIVAGTIVGATATMLLSYWRIEYRPRLGLGQWRALIGFGGWLTLSGFASQLGVLAPRILIGKMLSPATLGIYTIGREAVSMPLEEMLGPLRRTFFPSFSAIKDDPERLRRSVRLALTTLVGIALPVGVGIAVLAEEIITVLVGRRWLDAAIVLQVLGPTMALMLATSPISGLIMATGNLKSLFFRSMVVAGVAWVGIAFGISVNGLAGAVYAVAFNQATLLLLNLLFMRQLTGDPMWRFFASSWRSLVSAAVMAAVLLLVQRPFDAELGSLCTFVATLPYAALGAAAYGGVHMLLWRLAGRPDGFEANMLHYLGLASAALRQKLRGATARRGLG